MSKCDVATERYHTYVRNLPNSIEFDLPLITKFGEFFSQMFTS